MLQSTLTGVTSDAKKVSSVEVMTVEGKMNLSAKYFIDCSGDAFLAWMAGYSTEMRGRGHMQNVTSIIRMGNVDSERILENLLAARGIKGLEEWHIRVVRGKLLDGSEDHSAYSGACRN